LRENGLKSSAAGNIMSENPINVLRILQGSRKFYSLPQLEAQGVGAVSRIPVSIRILLESVIRNCDGRQITRENVVQLANWQPRAERTEEVPFVVSRVLLQDFTGVPLVVDLAAMRAVVARLGRDPKIVEPLVPVDLVIDHSVQVDFSTTSDAFTRNIAMEFKRNHSRYQFLKWGRQAFDRFSVMPPGLGICHQVNLEYLAQCVIERDEIYYPDTLVGTDSHTTMINGLGVVGWGVGGIEAEAAMLGQPVYLLTPDVVGVNMIGSLREGVTATDLVLRVTEMLRDAKVVGKFVEFHGEGAAKLPVTDRATIANMSPEYGATMGYFPVDEETCKYLAATGRSKEHVDLVRSYFTAQGMFGVPRAGECDYTQVIDLDLASIEPSVAGPKRPQDRIAISNLKETFSELLTKPAGEGGYGRDNFAQRHPTHIGVCGDGRAVPGALAGGGQQAEESRELPVINDVTPKETSAWTEVEMMNNRPTPDRVVPMLSEEFPEAHVELGHGDVVIAAITSCTNTSNPSVMLAAGLLAKKAVERGMKIQPSVKTSLAPGSRVVTNYLEKTGLMPYLAELGFHLAGYGCTTCIGNSGPIDPCIEQAIREHDLVLASVLSGNRNFEARVHQSIRANFLMSPPLVVAFALAGTVAIDVQNEPLGKDSNGRDVFLREIWPSVSEVVALMHAAFEPDTYRRLYANLADESPMWDDIEEDSGETYKWTTTSTYILEPPYFEKFSLEPEKLEEICGARPLAIFGDSVTTDHISPAGAIKPDSPAGEYLQEHGVSIENFNSYGARRGNHQVMVRGTFANVRIKNLMVSGIEGGFTLYQPSGEQMPIYDAAVKYRASGVPLVVIAGKEYGAGSSRDWAAKGTMLLGVKAVIAESFERIHRSNLIGMGVLPCRFKEGVNARTLKLDGTETFDLVGMKDGMEPREDLTLIIHRENGDTIDLPLTLRIETPVEVEYYRHGGILPYVLRQLLEKDQH
jgi:aconitate hydratase